jgi:polyphenol oxidase
MSAPKPQVKPAAQYSTTTGTVPEEFADGARDAVIRCPRIAPRQLGYPRPFGPADYSRAVDQTLALRPFRFSGDVVTAVVTTRHGGVSSGSYASLNLGDHVGDDHDAVLENRRRLAEALGVDRLTVPDQQHKNRVAVIDAALAGRGHNGVAESVAAFPATDAMITNLPGTAMTIMVADCAPVVIFDPEHKAVGVAHCGRGGTVRGVLPTTIEAMTARYGSVPADMLVGIGPAIDAASYEIGDAQAAEITSTFGDAGLLTPTRPGHCTLDVVGGLRIQLRTAGVKDANVHDMAIDTRTSTDTFFSDRAARPCGRFMIAAVLQD